MCIMAFQSLAKWLLHSTPFPANPLLDLGGRHTMQASSLLTCILSGSIVQPLILACKSEHGLCPAQEATLAALRGRG